MDGFEEIMFLRQNRVDMLVKWETVTVYITFAKVQDKQNFGSDEQKWAQWKKFYEIGWVQK